MIVLEFLTIYPCDAAEPWQLGSQDAATPMMQGIMDLHHDIFFFLILILVVVLRILVFRLLVHAMNRGGEGIDGAGPSAPRGPAESGVPTDENEREALRKKIRKAFAHFLKKFCDHYCGGRGFCGKYCSRRRENFDFLDAAHEIARSEYFYDQRTADIPALQNLLQFLRQQSRNERNWDPNPNSHFLYDLMRKDPPR